jgi:putative NADH-flavin reductase
MKIAVIGANGRTGKVFVEAALEAGHVVTAGVRRDNLLSANENLRFLHCDATNSIDIQKLIADQDAIVSLIGHTRHSEADVQAKAMKVLLDVIGTDTTRRFVTLTGTGVRFPGDRITFVDRVLNTLVSLIDPKRILDGANFVEILKSSTLHWTLIRVLKLVNTSEISFSLTTSGPAKLFVGRREVAQSILEVLNQDSFIDSAPIISSKKTI